MSNVVPSLAEFLSAPVADVVTVAPRTVILASGGTRRRAALAGIDPNSAEYVDTTRTELMSAVSQLFEHGVEHLFVPILVDGNAGEMTPGYREHLIAWIESGLAGPPAQADYARFNCQVRLVGAELLPDLTATARKLSHMSPKNSSRCLWFTAMPTSERAWDFVIERVAASGARTYREAVHAVYGMHIPTDDVLLLDFGKPQVFASAVPPLLICTLHCYWRQHLGYFMDAELIRRVFYDYAYNRPTWRADKTGRAAEIRHYGALYSDPPILGEGRRIGPFWFPVAQGHGQ